MLIIPVVESFPSYVGISLNKDNSSIGAQSAYSLPGLDCFSTLIKGVDIHFNLQC